LGRQVKENESLIEQIGKLQKEIEEFKKAEEKITDETVGWKTYRNEVYGFEIDYPATASWKFTEFYAGQHEKINPTDGFFFELCKKGFCIHFHSFPLGGCGIYFCPIKKDCEFSCKKLMDYIYECTGTIIKVMNFKEEIATDFGINGCRGEGGFPEEIIAVFFPLKTIDYASDAFLALFYYLEYLPDQGIYTTENYGPEEIETFNRIASTFRFIEK